MERVGIGLRIGAALIDVVIVIVLSLALGSVVGGSAIMFSPDAAGSYVAMLLMSILPLAYFSLEIFRAATPGKMVLKLKIANPDGSAANQATLIRRFCTKFAGSLLGLVGAITTLAILQTVGGVVGLVILIGFLLVLQPDKQALHDKVGKTAVFKAAA